MMAIDINFNDDYKVERQNLSLSSLFCFFFGTTVSLFSDDDGFGHARNCYFCLVSPVMIIIIMVKHKNCETLQTPAAKV